MVVGGGFEPPKSYDDRFTVCSLWPLGNPTTVWSWRWDSNPQPADYKSAALPVELRQPTEMCFYTRVHGLASIKTPFFEFAFKCFLSIRYVRLIFFSTIKVFTCALGTVSVGARLPRRGRGSCLLYCCVPLASPTLTVRIPSVLPAMVLVRAGACACALCPHWACLAACRVTVFPTFAPRLGAGHLARSCRGSARLWPSRVPASGHPC